MERLHSILKELTISILCSASRTEQIYFFVWLKNRIERSRSILCLIREPYEFREERRGRRALASYHFGETGAF
jgi:hypothetical protein